MNTRRGAQLLETKLEAIRVCAEQKLGVTLVPTVVSGINDDNLGEIISLAVSLAPGVRGIHFQPVSFFGRYPKSPEETDRGTLSASQFFRHPLRAARRLFLRRASASGRPRSKPGPRRCGPSPEGAWTHGTGRCRRRWSGAAPRSGAFCGTAGSSGRHSRQGAAGGPSTPDPRGCPWKRSPWRSPEYRHRRKCPR